MFAADMFACFTIGSAVVVATFVVFCIPVFFLSGGLLTLQH